MTIADHSKPWANLNDRGQVSGGGKLFNGAMVITALSLRDLAA